NAQQLVAFGNTVDAYAGGWSPNGALVAYNRVYYFESGGNYYWNNAYVCYWGSYYGDVGCLGTTNTEFRPDWQTTDPNAPVSSMTALPAASPIQFGVYWSGTDAGSGLAGYQVQE